MNIEGFLVSFREIITNTFYSILDYPFVRREFAVSLAVTLVCSSLSIFVVLKRLAFLGQGIAFAAFGWMAVGLFFGVDEIGGDYLILVNVIGICVLFGFFIGWTCKSRLIPTDSAIGIYLTAGFLLGWLAHFLRSDKIIDLYPYLFGSFSYVANSDLWLATGLVVVVLLWIGRVERQLFVFCFDPFYAKVIGIPTGFLHYGMLVALVVTIVVGIKTTSLLLVTSSLIIPGACARLMTDSLGRLIQNSIWIGIGSCLMGTVLSINIDRFPPDGFIAGIQLILFFFLFLIHRIRQKELFP